MPNKAPILTIAIPTYNRGNYLARLLESLRPQMEEASYLFNIELLISDNASTDSTSQVVETFCRNSSIACRTFRNQTNLGADRNILQCFSEATGRYVWIIGDDDILLPGALLELLKLLKQEDFDIVHLRAVPLVEGKQTYPRIASLEVTATSNPEVFALKTHIFLTFITGNIIHRERALLLPHEPFSSLIGTSLVQLGWTYTLLRHFRRGAVVANPVLAASSDARGGYALFTVFGTNLKSIGERWLVEPRLVQIVVNGTLQIFFPPFVLGTRRESNAFSEEEAENILSSLFTDNVRYRIFVSPLFHLPQKMARFWLLFNRVVNRVDKTLGNPMLR
ncbi:glycosyltransferase family 2 protein [Edaphobacter sp. 12200R-103]|jgi:glycosyltransferase involved in cell wall biosynthesis|uniref:glycosyltransferase family 2 protein n=1 Tax=Edaphobacter sp. 12200R-103 TaxID=2703788 RepID=UPI00138D3B05|nr:glycosyltransferase family 2 protein [Edaphobacter sp. 12200R-103]QHS52981.1 glycosyltransferase family 2 protein [Edaphobacter sp. 12200R-103]